MHINPNTPFDHSISVSAAPLTVRTANPTLKTTHERTSGESDIDRAANAFSVKSKRGHLEILAVLIHTEHGGTGFWNDLTPKRRVELGYDGWEDSSGRIMKVSDLEQIVSDRIAELGLDRNLLEAHLASHPTIAESQAFYNLDFDARMQKFRK